MTPNRRSTFGTRFGKSNGVSNTANGGPNANGVNSNGSPGYPASILKKRGQETERFENGDRFEARNDEVIRRVAEMQQILQVGCPI